MVWRWPHSCTAPALLLSGWLAARSSRGISAGVPTTKKGPGILGSALRLTQPVGSMPLTPHKTGLLGDLAGTSLAETSLIWACLAHKKCIHMRRFWIASCSPRIKISDLFRHCPGPGKGSNLLHLVGQKNPFFFQPEPSRSPGLPWPLTPQTIIAAVTREDSGQPFKSGQSKRGGGNISWGPRTKTAACSLQGARDQSAGLRPSPSGPGARDQVARENSAEVKLQSPPLSSLLMSWLTTCGLSQVCLWN